ncbi:MAG TPA: AfsR/SARP family transcriptional regulator [Streptosporangiaceae bacterium]
MDFGLLGPLVVRDGTRHVPVSAPRQRVLLAVLLLNAGRVVSLDALAETLWEGEPPTGARGALQSAVQRLRSTLGASGADLIETQPPGYLIRVDDGEFDIREFGVLVARGHAAAEAGDWVQAADLLRKGLGLWRGEPLADVPSRLLRDREVPAIEDQRLQALTARIDADLHLGRHGEVIAELRQLITAHPVQEQFHAQLMLSLYRSGRQADALAAYQDVRRFLADELGIDPGPELRLLHQRILASDSELLLLSGDEPSGSASAMIAPPPYGHSDPAAVHQNVMPRQLPAATRHFVGRAEALKALAGLAAEAAEAESAHGPVISVIDGTAGIGNPDPGANTPIRYRSGHRPGPHRPSRRSEHRRSEPSCHHPAVRCGQQSPALPDTRRCPGVPLETSDSRADRDQWFISLGRRWFSRPADQPSDRGGRSRMRQRPIRPTNASVTAWRVCRALRVWSRVRPVVWS